MPPLVPVALGFILGCAMPDGSPWWAVGALAALAVAGWRRHTPGVVAAGLLLASVCAGRCHVSPATDPASTRLIVTQGDVIAVYGSGFSQRFRLEDQRGDRWFVIAPTSPAIAAGDAVAVAGRWQQDQRGGVVYATRLERTQRREDGPRGWAWNAIARCTTHQELAGALLLGRGAPPERADFRASGLMHLLAVSGAHLAIAAALGVWLLRELGVGWLPRLMSLTALVLGYTWLTGASPATLRACAMVIALVIYDLARRTAHPLGPVSLAALGLALLDPGICQDIGFQLSLAAVVGMATLGYELVRWRVARLELDPWPLDRASWRLLLWLGRAVSDGTCLGIGAFLATAPLIAVHIGALTPWSAFTTLVAAPPATVALWSGLPLLLFSGLWPDGPWAGLYALLEGCLDALAWTVHQATKLPGSNLTVMPPAAWLLFSWPVLFVPGPGWWLATRLIAGAGGVLALALSR